MRAIYESAPFFFTDLHLDCIALVLRRIIDYYSARLVSLAVFGSYARKEPRFDSDLDLLIVLMPGTWSRLSERTEERESGSSGRRCLFCLKRNRFISWVWENPKISWMRYPSESTCSTAFFPPGTPETVLFSPGVG